MGLVGRDFLVGDIVCINGTDGIVYTGVVVGSCTIPGKLVIRIPKDPRLGNIEEWSCPSESLFYPPLGGWAASSSSPTEMQQCSHQWEERVLFTSTYTACSKCGQEK